MFYTHERNFGCRVNHELTYRGLRVMTLENESIKVSMLLDKGADIFEFIHKPSDTDFMWRSPLGVRPQPMNLNTIPSSEGGFMDYYEGGWQEILPNGGLPCTYRNCEMGMHGEVWGIPWDFAVEENTPECVRVRVWCRTPRSPYLLERWMTIRGGAGVLEIEEALTNESGQELDFMWGHHPAFGEPFLDETCVLECAATRVVVDDVGPESRLSPGAEFPWPIGKTRDWEDWDVSKVTPPEAEATEMTFLTDLEEGWYALTNRGRQVGFGMSFDLETFRHLWCWQALGGDFGYPFWGRTYTMAVEPFSGYPARLTEVVKDGRQLTIGPGETRRTWLKAVAYCGRDSVARVTEAGEVE